MGGWVGPKVKKVWRRESKRIKQRRANNTTTTITSNNKNKTNKGEVGKVVQ